MKTAEAVAQVAARLAAAGIADARREARLILAAAIHTDAAGLLARDEVPEAAFEPLVARRAAREPLAYILGRKEFWGLEFEVSPATLIPRPDSETLIEAMLTLGNPIRLILDLGTGTGCLLLAALSESADAFGVGVDVSPAAAALAAKNARNLGLGRRAAFIAGNWAAALGQKFDLILSNPPYIAGPDLPHLMPEVARFEPITALDGGPDGLAAYRAIIGGLARLLAPGGAAILELGLGQADDVAGLAAAAGFRTQTRRDLADLARALIIRA